jgi:hypothetical protein
VSFVNVATQELDEGFEELAELGFQNKVQHLVPAV